MWLFPGKQGLDDKILPLEDYRNNRLCLIQFSLKGGLCYLVKIIKGHSPSNIISLLENNNVEKIFHFARFDLAIIFKHLGIRCKNIYCTKIASKLSRTFGAKHGLKDLCKDLLNIELDKFNQTSDWGTKILSKD